MPVTKLTESATADPRPDPAPGESADVTRRRRRAPKSPLRRRMTRTLQVIVANFLLNYIVLPQIAGFGRAVSQLRTVNAALLVLGLGLELAAFFA